MATATLTPTLVGHYGDTDVYRIDLSQSGLASIRSIRINDDDVISGGTGNVSGFDLDFVSLSGTFITNPAEAATLATENAFDFSPSGVIFRPGFLHPVGSTHDPAWNTPNLSGSNQNQYDPAGSTLDVLDASGDLASGSLSLGEGGWLTLLLKYAVMTNAKYLYVGDRGSEDWFTVTVSDGETATTPPKASGVTLFGTSGHDSIVLGQGLNRHVGDGNDIIHGLQGNDLIGGAAGNDRLYGGSGRDTINGGSGNDTIQGGRSNDTIFGGSGRDMLDFSDGTKGISIVLSQSNSKYVTFDGRKAGLGIDKYRDMEGLIGTQFRDKITGSTGGDILSGLGGNDVLRGGAGNGDDVFVFERGGGRDRVMDFGDRGRHQDVLDLTDFGFNIVASTFAAWKTEHVRQVGQNTVVSLDSSTSVILMKVKAKSVSFDDFHF
jgi:Ca2+-binding RTX toxin-like protein